jgi:hypothetical protein
MLVVRVELHSAITGRITELARATITNTGAGTKQRGDYVCKTLRGRSKAALDRGTIQNAGTVTNWPRLSKHVWYLVAKALNSMGYMK